MKVVKISAIWCGACLIMNKHWNRLKKEFSFEAVEFDYDMDEEKVQKYNPGKILPVFLFFDGDQEIARFTGEMTYENLSRPLREEKADEEDH